MTAASAIIEVDGSLFSGSGTIVRQAAALAALTGRPAHIINARARRPKPGLRRQHLAVIRAIADLASARVEGCVEGSQELMFHPGPLRLRDRYRWDIGSAGSTTMLALGVLPVLAMAGKRVSAELTGGVFQDFAPSFFHLKHVLLPLLRRFGIAADIELVRPGYVPAGMGVLRLTVEPSPAPLRPVVQVERGSLERVWGIALASRLQQRMVAQRMAAAATRLLAAAGHRADFELIEDETAEQPGAALAIFADFTAGARLGADRAGAPRRSAEAVARYATDHLLEDIASGATLDRHAADQVIPFAALADGESRFRIPGTTDHVESGIWLARLFLGARVAINGQEMRIHGAGWRGRGA